MKKLLLFFVILAGVSACSTDSGHVHKGPSGGILFTERDGKTGVSTISWVAPDGGTCNKIISYAKLIAPPANGTMLYTLINSNPDVPGTVYAVGTDGTEIRPVFKYPYAPHNPQWVQLAPNGAFVGYALASDSTMLHFADTYGRELGTIPGGLRGLVIAPDSRHLSYLPGDRGAMLVLVDIAQPSARDTIRLEAATAELTTWSPDASAMLVRAEDSTGIGNIYSVNCRTKALHLIAREQNGRITNMQWSPNGNSIAMCCNGRLWLMKADGRDLQQLTDSTIVTANGIEWSRNSNRILFTAHSPSAGVDLMLVDRAAPVPRTIRQQCVDGHWDQ
jgi:hypothetical protein